MCFTNSLYPDAFCTPNSNGYYPLHLVCLCGNYMSYFADSKFPCSWRCISNDVFKIILFSYPEAASLRAGHDCRTPLNCLCVASYRSAEPLEAVQSLLNVYPKAASIPNDQGRYPLHTACNTEDLKIVGSPDPSHIIQSFKSCIPELLSLRPVPRDAIYCILLVRT